MTDEQTGGARRELAAALLVVLGLAVPAVLLAGHRVWGRVEPTQSANAPVAERQAPDLFSGAGKTWVGGLTNTERDWLMQAFRESLDALVNFRVPDVGDPPELCATELNIPLVVTLYRPGQRSPTRLEVRKPSLAEAVEQAARQARVALGGRANLEELRVHMTVLREAVPLNAEQRAAFVQRRFGEPVAVATMAQQQGVTRMLLLLPVDAASTTDTTARASAAGVTKGLHGEMLEILCRQAGFKPGAWRRADRMPLWLVKTESFVNEPGSSRTVEGARALLRQGRVQPEVLRESLTGAVRHLGRSQSSDGAFTIIYATGLTFGCSSIVLQCEAAEAAAHAAGALDAPEAAREVALKGVAYAIVNTIEHDEERRLAYVHREESCREVYELEATAQTLAALCRYALAGGTRPVSDDALSLLKFLMFVRDAEQGFHLRYDPQTGRAWTPQEHSGVIVPRARAVHALCLAYEWLQEPDLLLLARSGMQALFNQATDRAEELSPTEMRWLAQAMLEYAPHDPGKMREHADLLGRLARRRLALQIGPDEAPYWDVVGGASVDYPPTSRTTAEDLVLLLGAYSLGAHVEGLQAGIDRATRFLLRMQFTERNTYAFPDASRRIGAYRKRSDRKLVDLAGTAVAMEALALSLELTAEENAPR